MTDAAPSPDREPARDEREKLYVTDAEIIRRLGVPERCGRAALKVLDGKKGIGFPPKEALWGNRRYWPAVKKYFERRSDILSNRRG